MRIALLSDIDGNPLALDAVLMDIEAQGGVDAYWAVGDLAALGYAPAATLERLSRLPRLLEQMVEVARSFAWTRGALVHTGWMDWLSALPIEHRMVLPDGTRMLPVHASPGRDDGTGGLRCGPGVHGAHPLADGSAVR